MKCACGCGQITPIAKLHHICGNRACVNPHHLELIEHRRHTRIGGRAKLNEAAVAEIRASSETNGVLAERFGVSGPAISYARSGKTWA